MPDKKNEVSEELYSQHLKIIAGIKFTRRQIDVIAYIVSGWDVKSIAAHLSIAPSTVETHIDMIVQKLGSGGRNSIIHFVERSGKDKEIKQYYQLLKIGSNFPPSDLAINLSEKASTLVSKPKTIKYSIFKLSVIIIIVLGATITGFVYLNKFFSDTKIAHILTYHSSSISDKTHHQSLPQSQPIPVITWNLPRSLEHYIERKSLTNIIWRNFADREKKRTATLIGLHGLGGIGKTTLATHLIRNPPKEYQFRGWFRAETQDLLEADYISLGEKFHLFAKEMPDNLKIKIVKEWLENKSSSLLVYDNAPDMETLDEFLPDQGHVIITSRNYKMPEAIEVDVMQESEALELLGKLIPKKVQQHPNYPEASKKLIRKLACLPLALSQAGFYINENMLTLSEYLELYATNQNKLLAENSLPPGDLHESVYITWDINIQKLQKLPEGGQVLKLLNFIAYCYPENIPKKLLMHYLYGSITGESEMFLNSLLNLLRQYSLIKLSSGSIGIHRLVHEWVKLKHKETLKIDTLQKGKKSVQSIYSKYNNNVKNVEIIKDLLIQGEYILNQLQPLVSGLDVVELASLLGNGYGHILGIYGKSKQYFEVALDINRRYLGSSHINTAISLQNVASPYLYLGHYIEAKKVLEEALETTERYYGNNHIELANILLNLSWANIRLGDYVKSKELSKNALAIINRNHGPNHEKTAHGLNSLGWAYMRLGKSEEANKLLSKALDIVRVQYGTNHIETARLMNSFARSCNDLGNYTSAKELYNKALDIVEKFYGYNHVEKAFIIHNLGWTYYFLGLYESARELLETSLTIKKRHYGIHHINTAKAFRNLSWIYFSLGKYADAKRMIKISLPIIKNYYGSDHVDMVMALHSLSWVLFNAGKFSKAKQILEKALKIAQKSYGSRSIIVAYLLSSIGIFECHSKNYIKAEDYMKKSIDISKKLYGNEHIFTAKLIVNLGNLHRMMNKVSYSEELLKKALSFFRKFYGTDNVNVAIVIGDLGLLYGEQGKRSTKIKYLKKARDIFHKYLSSEHIYIKQIESELRNVTEDSSNNITKAVKSIGYFIIY